MVVTLMVVLRWVFDLQHLVTIGHLEKMNKIMLATGTIVGYAYGTEFFIAWYSGNPYEQFVFLNRAMGPYAWAYWTMVSCNVIFPLHRDFLPSSWGCFSPTIIDVLTYVGTFGLFFTLILLFVRFLPIIAISEVKGAMEADHPAH